MSDLESKMMGLENAAEQALRELKEVTDKLGMDFEERAKDVVDRVANE